MGAQEGELAERLVQVGEWAAVGLDEQAGLGAAGGRAWVAGLGGAGCEGGGGGGDKV